MLILLPLLFFAALCYGVARQLAMPRGWLGRRVMARAMNEGNKKLLDAALDTLQPTSGEAVVDVGFGGAYAIDQLRVHVAPARPTGVEISDAMIDAGRARWGDQVALHSADVTAMPLEDASQDAVLSINTTYFWSDPQAALREIRRVLRPAGRLILGVQPRGMMRLSPISWFGFRLYSISALEELLRQNGFVVRNRPGVNTEWVFLATVAVPPEDRTAAYPK